MSVAVRTAGELAAHYAMSLWELDIYDAKIRDFSPEGIRCKEVISQITEACSFGRYKGDGSGVQWCSMFWFYCWKNAGSLDPKYLEHFSQSTFRVECLARYLPFNGANPGKKPVDKFDRRLWVDLRQPLTIAPQEGDMVIVGDGNPEAGDHATLLLSYDPATGIYNTVAGNGGGVGPRGNPREGISRHSFGGPLPGLKPMWLFRPGFGDLIAEAGEAG